MMNNPFAHVRLSRLPASLKLLLTMFLLLMGVGYAIALLNLYLTYSPIDGKEGFSPNDLKRAFHGEPQKETLLAAKLEHGTMAAFLTNPADKNKVLGWIHNGTPEATFASNVQPIMQANCVRCHSETGPAKFRPLTNYQQVMAVAQPDHGESLQSLARIAHFHILAFALMFLCIGLIFSCTQLPESVKLAVIGLPYLCIVIDFAARGLAKLHPDLVYGTMLSGGLMGASFAVMTLTPLYELWLKREMRQEVMKLTAEKLARSPTTAKTQS
jgi:hypothetical protein